MLDSLKERLKSFPMVYDVGTRIKRVAGIRPPCYPWFDALSRSLDHRIRFIQIGANDGLRNDPIREFIVRDGWTGTFVEPVPSVYALLKSNYRKYEQQGLLFLNVAVSSSSSAALKFHTFRDEFLEGLDLGSRMDCLRKASFDRAHVQKHLSREHPGVREEYALASIEVPTLSIAELTEMAGLGSGYDLLVIDAEGHECEILGGMDLEAEGPAMIFFESHHLGEGLAKVNERLESHGYTVNQVGGDSVAYQNDVGLPP